MSLPDAFMIPDGSDMGRMGDLQHIFTIVYDKAKIILLRDIEKILNDLLCNIAIEIEDPNDQKITSLHKKEIQHAIVTMLFQKYKKNLCREIEVTKSPFTTVGTNSRRW